MARKLRVEFEGAIYHVTMRGVERRRIFWDDADRGRFVKRMGEAADEYGVRVYLFACMLNHTHILCETPQANLSAFMHKLQTAYTVYYNLRHRRVGHLMQGRFGAQLVSGDEYLLKLSRYIHLNPVFVRGNKALPPEERVRRLRDYRWSSYRGYAGLDEPYAFIDEAPILAQTGASAKRERQAYRRYVEAGIVESDEEFQTLLKTSRWGIGDEVFQTQVRARHTERTQSARRREDVSFRRVNPVATAAMVLDAVAREFGVEPAALQRRQYDCVARAAAALLLGRYAGMNQRDSAGLLGMGSGSAVCRHLQRLRDRQVHDVALTERIARAARAIAAAHENPELK